MESRGGNGVPSRGTELCEGPFKSGGYDFLVVGGADAGINEGEAKAERVNLGLSREALELELGREGCWARLGSDIFGVCQPP